MSCSAAYYATLEKFGIEKRDILVDRIKSASAAQTDAKQQFASALDEYRSVVHFEGGDLEREYNRLNSAYEDSARRADEVRKRIESVQKVANDLFTEWEGELGAYTDPALRRRSARLLRDTRARYRQVLAAMQRASGSMDPVLALFHDQVLSLKHDLNARAIGALGGQLDDIEKATAALIRDMERAIAEAGDFIDAMGKATPAH